MYFLTGGQNVFHKIYDWNTFTRNVSKTNDNAA